ncbi:hypothetical protein [Terrabacter sp. NPDC080008]|uniref:hypothetical protein n=1 Tax=Terrabacter sp. NPDC080008 TaxID=3155176 RepID=UPI00345003C9
MNTRLVVVLQARDVQGRDAVQRCHVWADLPDGSPQLLLTGQRTGVHRHRDVAVEGPPFCMHLGCDVLPLDACCSKHGARHHATLLVCEFASTSPSFCTSHPTTVALTSLGGERHTQAVDVRCIAVVGVDNRFEVMSPGRTHHDHLEPPGVSIDSR